MSWRVFRSAKIAANQGLVYKESNRSTHATLTAIAIHVRALRLLPSPSLSIQCVCIVPV